MNDTTQQKRFDRAVLVGLNASVLTPEENATEETMDELAALLETAGGQCVGVITSPRTPPTPAPSSARARWPR